MSDERQELEDAIADDWVLMALPEYEDRYVFAGPIASWFCDPANRDVVLAAIRAHLPEGTVLTRSGVAKLTHVADFDWDLDQDTGLAEPFACNWSPDADEIGSLNAGLPLFTLTPERQDR